MLRHQHGRADLLSRDEHGQWGSGAARSYRPAGPAAPRLPLRCGASEYRRRSTTSRSAWSIYASYSRGLQVPSTDLLYNSFFFPTTTAQAKPDTGDDRQFRHRSALSVEHAAGPAGRLVYDLPESSGAGLRSGSRRQRVPQPWHRASLRPRPRSSTIRPIPELSVHLFGSYLWSNIKGRRAGCGGMLGDRHAELPGRQHGHADLRF